MREGSLHRIGDAFEVVFHLLQQTPTRVEVGPLLTRLGEAGGEVFLLLAELAHEFFLFFELGLLGVNQFDRLGELALGRVALGEQVFELLGDLAGALVEFFAGTDEGLLEGVDGGDLVVELGDATEQIGQAVLLVLEAGAFFVARVLELTRLGLRGFETRLGVGLGGGQFLDGLGVLRGFFTKMGLSSVEFIQA